MREDISLRLADDKTFNLGVITKRRIANEIAILSGFIEEEMNWQKDIFIDYILFVLPNFQKLVGAPIYFPGKTSSNRLTLNCPDWIITLDAVENQNEVFELLESQSGFRVTHFCKLEKTNGEAFSWEDAFSILETFNWYISFSIGRWTGYCLPFGFNDAGEQVWQSWNLSKVEPFIRESSWLGWGSRRNIFEEPFLGFLDRWHDENWKEIIKLAIHWYIEANSQRGSIEGSIILVQTALELLASAILVENDNWLSEDGFNKLPASDKIRILLLWAKIPAEIPEDIHTLVQISKQLNWTDGVKAITEIRNKLTHPKKSNRKNFILSRDIKIGAWKLSLWYLELLLLRLFQYEGKYANRIVRQFTGETEPLPWSENK